MQDFGFWIRPCNYSCIHHGLQKEKDFGRCETMPQRSTTVPKDTGREVLAKYRFCFQAELVCCLVALVAAAEDFLIIVNSLVQAEQY